MQTLRKTTLRLDVSLMKTAKKLAVDENLSLTEMVNQALRRYLKNLRPARKNFYRWAEQLAKKKGFQNLSEEDVIKIIHKSRNSARA